MKRFLLALAVLVSNFAHAAANQVSEAEARVFGTADGAVDMSPKFDLPDISWGWLFVIWFVAAVLVCLFFAGAKRLNKRYDGTEFQDSQNFSA